MEGQLLMSMKERNRKVAFDMVRLRTWTLVDAADHLGLSSKPPRYGVSPTGRDEGRRTSLRRDYEEVSPCHSGATGLGGMGRGSEESPSYSYAIGG